MKVELRGQDAGEWARFFAPASVSICLFGGVSPCRGINMDFSGPLTRERHHGWVVTLTPAAAAVVAEVQSVAFKQLKESEEFILGLLQIPSSICIVKR